MGDVMQKFPRRWDDLTCVNFLQRKIILNCIAYYELNTSILTDKEFDVLSMQLVELHKRVNLKDTEYGYIMHDFDGTTGFDLFHRLNAKDKEYLLKLANYIFVKPEKKLKQGKRKRGLF